MLINEWWKKYTTGEIKKDYDGNYGVQCVDTANSYAEHVLGFGKGVFYGVRYAKEIFTNHNKKLFYSVQNAKTNYPKKGNLVIWNRGTAGHIAIVLRADKHNIEVLESNYDGKGSCRQFIYTNYNNVVGWLVPYKKGNCSKGLLIKLLYHRNDFDVFTENESIVNGESIPISGTSGPYTQVQNILSFKSVDDRYILSEFLK